MDWGQSKAARGSQNQSELVEAIVQVSCSKQISLHLQAKGLRGSEALLIGAHAQAGLPHEPLLIVADCTHSKLLKLDLLQIVLAPLPETLQQSLSEQVNDQACRLLSMTITGESSLGKQAGQ